MTVQWVDFRDDDGWLLFRYDPARRIVQTQRRGKRKLHDLTECETVKSCQETPRPLDTRQ